MGGALSLYTATKNPNIGACIVFYGIHPKVTPDMARELERQVKDLGKQIEVVIYPDADHAFFNDTRPEVYNATAATDAWRRTIEFLRKHLS